jgi:dienelactone hydrolase
MPPLAADVAGRLPVLVGDGAARTTLSGVLALPARQTAAPGVVLMHGCSGVSANMRRWAEALRAWGYATFVLDSFGGRGLGSVCENAALSSDARVPDAYAALALLARHPRIDGSRIALMGFSHGGGVVLLASARSITRVHVSAGEPAFRAFVAFYPRCEGRYPGTLAAPLRVHIGALDDWTPAPPCEVMVGSLRSGGADAWITVYAGARHAFDSAALPPERWLPNVRAPHGRRGASVGHSPEATARARDNVRRELGELLGG